MDQMQQFYEYTTQNPLNQILDQYRISQDFQSGSLRRIDYLLLDMRNYIKNFCLTTNNNSFLILDRNISHLQVKILNGEIPNSEFEYLIYLVNYRSDREIWDHVILISDALTRAPPPILPDLQIPMTEERTSSVTLLRNVAEQADYDNTTNALEEALRAELTEDTYKAVDKFWDVNFQSKSWYGITTLVWERYRDGGQCGGENVFSANMNEERMKSWFRSFDSIYLEPLRAPAPDPNQPPPVHDPNVFPIRGKFSYTTSQFQLKGGRRNRQVDVFIEHSDIVDEYSWENVRVLGEFTKSGNKKSVKFHQLTRYVREVFYAQPLRRFVHGFLLHKKHVVFWIIDRSGAYSSREFNVIDSQEILVRALTSYMLMSDEELGLDTTILKCNGRFFVNIREDEFAPRTWIEIRREPVTRPETILARGNTCYLTMNMKYLIKFTWGSGAEFTEIDYLKAARGVHGVIDLNWSDHIYQVESHRAGLDFSTGKQWKMGEKNWLSIEKDGKPKEYYKRRKLTLAVISPYGRPFKTCTSVLEFLSGMVDAIIGHRNLYLCANIVHGDTSESNIILTTSGQNGVIRGKLIDLDMSTYVAGDDIVRSITGTMKFMAIKVLRNLCEKETSMVQTYRHDLESFFYVFLNGCVCYGRETNSHDKHFNEWSSPKPSANIAHKSTDIGMSFQNRIIDHFSPCFNGLKELAYELRHILFGANVMSLDTPRQSAVLYDPIIAAFLKTINKINNGTIINETWTLRA